VIKLRNLGDMRLEVFRRINQGGTPLSGQDIRLAYYGADSPSLALVRLAGVYNPDTPASRRFRDRAAQLGLDYPWTDALALGCWRDWWADKEIARGQAASEAFLWSLISAQVEQLDVILQNTSALLALNCRFSRAVAEALDVCCAQLRYQDENQTSPPAIMSFSEMKERFFPFFQRWIRMVLGQKGPNLPVTKHRGLAAAIGAAYALHMDPDRFGEQRWTDLVEFIRRPQDLAKRFEVAYPQSRGRWDGGKGYKTQLLAARGIVQRIAP
jgi:hypothetical protein